MRISVTGGSGLAGRHVVSELRQAGHEVVGVDRTPPHDRSGDYRLADLTDFGQSVGALAGSEAVVHLAAIPRPTYHPDPVVFHTNVLSSYNVLEAAALLGIRRVVSASSISVLGPPFNPRPALPDYLPVDEAHPRRPQEAYALSKVVGEIVADALVRRTNMTIVSLRLAWIHTPATFVEQLRPLWDDPAEGAANLWAYIDARDAARACRLALEADLTGHLACFVAAADTFMPTPSRDLARHYLPTSERRPTLTGRAAMVSGALAAQRLNFEPHYRWEDYVDPATGG